VSERRREKKIFSLDPLPSKSLIYFIDFYWLIFNTISFYIFYSCIVFILSLCSLLLFLLFFILFCHGDSYEHGDSYGMGAHSQVFQIFQNLFFNWVTP
jgi:hypothetical protein